MKRNESNPIVLDGEVARAFVVWAMAGAQDAGCTIEQFMEGLVALRDAGRITIGRDGTIQAIVSDDNPHG